MSCVDKTQLAIEYTYRHQAACDTACWTPAEQPSPRSHPTTVMVITT